MSKTEDYIRRTVDAAPPLTEGQRDTLRPLLRSVTRLDDAPPPDEATARHLARLLNIGGVKISEPVRIDLDD